MMRSMIIQIPMTEAIEFTFQTDDLQSLTESIQVSDFNNLIAQWPYSI